MKQMAVVLGLVVLVGSRSLLHGQTTFAIVAARPSPPAAVAARALVHERLEADLASVHTFRPSYPFWRHIFVIPDGRIAYGSAQDGHLIATFPVKGDWARNATWQDPTLAITLDGQRLAKRLNDRREQVVKLLEPQTGPLVNNPTRGEFLLPNAERYGGFLEEWGTIYERFGVPAEIGLAQAILESGLDGKARSRARAIGLCQWLTRNWNYLNKLTPEVLEAYNQTTQAPYCAAYLSILATMYGSFIPALSEHHAGGVNVGRTVINGERLGGTDTREQYFLGSEFAANLREISIRRYRDLFRSYGPRSALYVEMVFGNMVNVTRLKAEYPQVQIFGMRTPRTISLDEITRKTGLTEAEVRTFNPALKRRVPARATLYLPTYVEQFGEDVTFWHRPPNGSYATTLNEFLQMDFPAERWLEASFESTLRSFQDRFARSGSEEGDVMATTLRYVIDDLRTSRRAAILEEFRTSGRILDLFRKGAAELGLTIGVL